MKIFNVHEMDRPTSNSLEYVMRLKPHPRGSTATIVDPYVYQILIEWLEPEDFIWYKDYTRSYYTLSGHYSRLWEYDIPIVSRPSDPALTLAIQAASEEFKLDTPVTSLDFESDLGIVPFIPSSGAGYGYTGKKGSPGNLPIAIKRAHSNLLAWINGKYLDGTKFKYHPDVAYYRTQLGTVQNPKIRHVWGKAFDNILLEGLSAAPLMAAYVDRSHPMPIGMNFYRQLPQIISKALGSAAEPNIGVGIDIKDFDAHLQPWLIDAAFNIILENITFPNALSKAAFHYSWYHLIHTPVIMPDGRLWITHLGMPSGSYFTQLIDSICNMICIKYAQQKIYNRTFTTSVLGDDSLFGIPKHYGWPNINLFQYHLSNVGMILHPTKFNISQRPHELEYLGHLARGPRLQRKDAIELMRLALYTEDPVLTSQVSLSRITGLLLDSQLNSWSILNLFHIHQAKFPNNVATIPEEFRILGTSYKNKSPIDMVKCFCL